MKTSHAARHLLKIRITLTWLAIAAIAVIEFQLGQTLAARIDSTAALQTAGSPAPNVGIADFVAAAAPR